LFKRGKILNLRFETRLLARQFLRPAVIRPEFGLTGKMGDFFDAPFFDRKVKVNLVGNRAWLGVR